MKKIVTVLGLLGLTHSFVVSSAEYTLDITASPIFGYDDNVLLNVDEEDSFTFEVAPTLVLGRAVENMSSTLSLGYAVERFSSISRLDSENPFVRFSSNHDMERTQLGLNVSYVEDSVRNEAEEDTGDFSTDATSRTRSISPSISFQLSEQDTLTSSFTYTEREYSSEDFEDNDNRSLNLGWTRQFTERLSGGLNTTISNYQTDGLTFTTDDDSYNVSASASYQLSEVWSVEGDIGFRRLDTERTSNLGVVTKDDSNGSTFNVSTSYGKERDSVIVNYTKQLSPSSSGVVNEQESVRLEWSRKLSEQLTAKLIASYRETRTASEQSSDNKRENINLSPSIRWQVDANWNVNLGYHYKEQKRDTAKDVDSNAVLMTVTYDWDGLRVSR